MAQKIKITPNRPIGLHLTVDDREAILGAGVLDAAVHEMIQKAYWYEPVRLPKRLSAKAGLRTIRKMKTIPVGSSARLEGRLFRVSS